MKSLQRFSAHWPLIAILLLGGILRFGGIGFGLPYTYAADEPTRWGVALHMVQTGDLDPHWLGYPHLAFYLNALALLFYFAAGRLAGTFRTPADIIGPEVVTIGVGKLALPGEFLVARGLTALLGTGAILLVYLIACRLTQRKSIGLLSALAFAVSPAAVLNSQMLSLDMFGLFFLLLALYWIIPLLQEPRLRQYVLAGIGVGLAFSGKYNVGVVVVPLALAHFLSLGWRGLFRRELYVAGAASLLVFAIANPFSMLDIPGFFHGLTMASDSQSQYAGTAGNGMGWYLNYLWSVEGIAIALAILQSVRLIRSSPKLAAVLLSFPVLYFLFVSQFPVRNDRTILPVIPFLDVLGAWFLVNLYDWLSKRYPRRRRLSIAGLASACALFLVLPLQTTLAADWGLMQVNGRETARAWIDSNLPAGTRIAEEGYSPYVDTARFVVQGVVAIVDHDPEWYVQNGFEYLVLSQGMYGRFLAEPDGYAKWVEKYNRFFDRFPLVKRFDDNGYEIRLYATGVRLPIHRVGARFGNDGDLVELVGYEESAAEWRAGAPLTVRLYWRTLREESEPLELALRVVGDGGREIGHARGDLFQGRRWPAGIALTEWQVPVESGAGPGLYKLDVEVIQARYAYAAPAKAWNGDNLDPPELGPFKQRPSPVTSGELQAAPAGVHWSDQIALLGYSALTRPVHAGDTVPLTFYWQALRAPSGDYKFFVHLMDAAGAIVAQVDVTPRRGAYPTSIWEAGETLEDDIALTLPSSIAPGSYTLEIGWYSASTLTRLSITTPANQVESDRWIVPEAIEVIP